MSFLGIRVNKDLEELIPNLTQTDGTLSDIELAVMETRLRELLASLSQLKWIIEAQSAFVESIIPQNAPDDMRRVP